MIAMDVENEIDRERFTTLQQSSFHTYNLGEKMPY